MTARATMGVLVLAAILSSTDASADRRLFPFTYQYATMERGAGELEHYLTFSGPSGGLAGQAVAEHQVEIEVGMSDRFDVGIYQVFASPAGEPLSYEGFKVRGRYRVAEKGALPVDILFYLEGAESADFEESEIEAKLVLAKDVGPVVVSLNPVFEAEREDEWETEVGYAAGIAWNLLGVLSVGAEARGGDEAHYAGPAIGHGNDKFWMTLGASFRYAGTDADGPKMQFRLITGIAL